MAPPASTGCRKTRCTFTATGYTSPVFSLFTVNICSHIKVVMKSAWMFLKIKRVF
jgi:hypothetical protein